MTGEPVLPYGGTSGWSGSETSQARASQEDHDGTTSERQRDVLVVLGARGYWGVTVSELREHTNWHHGKASSALTALHIGGKIARLTEVRNRCKVYVLPQHVGDREVEQPRRNRSAAEVLSEVEERLTSASMPGGFLLTEEIPHIIQQIRRGV